MRCKIHDYKYHNHIHNSPQPPTMSPKESLKDKASKDIHSDNPTQLGDPVSLKAETSDKQQKPPTKDDGGGSGNGGKEQKKGSLAEAAMKNPTLLGDPVSLKVEKDQSGSDGPQDRKEEREGGAKKEEGGGKSKL